MQIDKDILIRYFLGQASEAEKSAIQMWVESDEANRKSFVRERIRFDATVLVDERAILPAKRFYVPAWAVPVLKVAATVLLLIGSIYLYDTYQANRMSQTFQMVHVPPGNRTNIVLPDGTNVWLNANTSLRYPVAFSKKNREIYLDGEAFFEVVKENKPFIVKTDKYNVEVLGTTFDVDAYADKSEFKTTLYEGKVKLYGSQKNESVLLSPGQTAQLVGNTLQVTSTIDTNSYRWKDGLIYIENQSFEEIMELFEKFYDIQIVVKNKAVNELGYRGKLRISDGIDHALKVLQNDFPFAYNRDEEKNIIYIN